MANLTKQIVEAAWRNRTGERTKLRDDAVKGLLLELNRHGAAWRLEYRLPGLNPESGERWPNDAWTIGALSPELHLAEARKLAREGKAKVARGVDPKAEQKVALRVQLAETAAAVRTVAALAETYEKVRSPGWQPATVKAFKGDLATITSALGHLPVHKVTRKALANFLQEFVDEQVAEGHRGTRVERLRMLLGSMFLFAVDRDWIEVSPAQRLPLPSQSESRDRTLSAEELHAAWSTLSIPHVGVGEGLRLLLKLSLVTGQRIGAVGLAREADLDLDGQDDPDLADSGPRWLIRGVAGVKADRDRVLPLSPLAVRLFREAIALPGRKSGGFVFRGKKVASALSQQSVSRAWGLLREGGKVPADTVPHDLRRTARTWWPELAHGQEEHILERILGHVVGTKTKRAYDRALWLPQQRKVLDAWGRKIETITSGGAKVVGLAREQTHA